MRTAVGQFVLRLNHLSINRFRSTAKTGKSVTELTASDVVYKERVQIELINNESIEKRSLFFRASTDKYVIITHQSAVTTYYYYKYLLFLICYYVFVSIN